MARMIGRRGGSDEVDGGGKRNDQGLPHSTMRRRVRWAMAITKGIGNLSSAHDSTSTCFATTVGNWTGAVLRIELLRLQRGRGAVVR